MPRRSCFSYNFSLLLSLLSYEQRFLYNCIYTSNNGKEAAAVCSSVFSLHLLNSSVLTTDLKLTWKYFHSRSLLSKEICQWPNHSPCWPACPTTVQFTSSLPSTLQPSCHSQQTSSTNLPSPYPGNLSLLLSSMSFLTSSSLTPRPLKRPLSWKQFCHIKSGRILSNFVPWCVRDEIKTGTFVYHLDTVSKFSTENFPN